MKNDENGWEGTKVEWGEKEIKTNVEGMLRNWNG